MSAKVYGPRYREFGYPGRTGSSTYTGYYASGTPTGETYSQFFETDKGFTTMHDVVVQDFHKRIANGEIINNPMVKTMTSATTGGGSYHATHIATGNYSVIDGDSVTAWKVLQNNPQPSEPYVPHEASVNLAKLNALTRLDVTPYEFAEDVGEFGETMRFLRKPFQEFNELGRKFSHITSLNVTKMTAAEAIAKAWLEMRYAVRPLLYSSWNALEAYFDQTTRPVRRTARGFSRVKDSNNENITQNHSATNIDYYSYGWELEDNCRAYILYEVDNPIDSVLEKLGLRFKDVPVTMWNLMSLSWAIDRFIDISSVIRAVVNLSDPSLRILAAGVTRKAKSREYWQWLSQTSQGYTVSGSGDLWIRESENKSRTLWIPSFVDVYPNVRVDFTDAAFNLDLLSLAINWWQRPIRI